MTDIHDNIVQLMKSRNVSSNELSEMVEKSDRYMAGTLKHKRDFGVSVLRRICLELKVTPNELLGIDDGHFQAAMKEDEQFLDREVEVLLKALSNRARGKLHRFGVEPTINEIIDWWSAQGGILDGESRFSEFIDIYKMPDTQANRPIPVKMGHDSLAARTFGFSETGQLANLFEDLDRDRNERVVRAHLEVNSGQPLLSLEKVDFRVPGTSGGTELRYNRLLIPFRDRAGNHFVANHSSAIG